MGEIHEQSPPSCSFPQAKRIRAGPNGARVMRVHKGMLLQLMKYDQELADLVQSYQVKGMQRELEAVLALACEKVRAKKAAGSASINDVGVECDVEDLYNFY